MHFMVAEELKSKCHNSTVSPLRGGAEGEYQCDVCGNKCEVEGAGQTVGGANAGEKKEDAPAVSAGAATGDAIEQKAGNVCILESGDEGVLEEQEVDGEKKLVCVEKKAE